MFESIKDQIKDIKPILLVTGTGISQESEIQLFETKMDYGEIMMQ